MNNSHIHQFGLKDVFGFLLFFGALIALYFLFKGLMAILPALRNIKRKSVERELEEFHKKLQAARNLKALKDEEKKFLKFVGWQVLYPKSERDYVKEIKAFISEKKEIMERKKVEFRAKSI